MACQSETTNPSKPIWPLSTSVISSLLACILTGLPRPSSVQSTLENDGITEPTWCLLHGRPVRRERQPGERPPGRPGRRPGRSGRRPVPACRGVVGRQPVAGEVLGGRQHPVGVVELAGPALQPVDDRLHRRTRAGVLAEALVGAAPPVVARDADAGREGPLGPEARVSSAVIVADPAHQPRVAGGAEADVVREDGRAQQVAVAVHRVHAVEQRDAQPGAAAPRAGTRRPCRPTPAAVLGVGTEPPPESTLPRPERGDQRRVVGDVGALGLGHLADLLGQGHPAEQVGDPRARPAARRPGTAVGTRRARASVRAADPAAVADRGREAWAASSVALRAPTVDARATAARGRRREVWDSGP